MSSLRIGLPFPASIALLVFVSSCTPGSTAPTARPVDESSAGLQATVVAQQTQSVTQQQQMAGLQAAVVAQQTQIASQQQQVAGLQATVVVQQTQIGAQQQQVAGIQATVIAQQTQIASQQQQVAGIQVTPGQPQSPAAPTPAPIVATTPGAIGRQFVQALAAGDNRGALALMSAGAQSNYGPRLSAMSAALRGCAGSNVETTTTTSNDIYSVHASFVPPCGDFRDFYSAEFGVGAGGIPNNQAVQVLTITIQTVNEQSNRVTFFRPGL